MNGEDHMSEARLIIGLGNPGREYRETRHNIGFMVLDRLAIHFNVRFSRLQSKSLIASGRSTDHRFILAKPQTFMNLSGQSVRALMRFYKIDMSDLLVVHDDLDLSPGTLRIRPDGGSPGQRGMTSIIEYLGTDQFPRLRLGIGRPPGSMDPADFVLQNFSAAESPIIMDILSLAVDAVLCWGHEGIEKAMTQYNVSK